MSLAVFVSVYTVGFLVFPFFYSLFDGWPFVSSRVGVDDVFFSLLLCVTWPLVAFGWLMFVWWCGLSRLGVSARELCNRLAKALDHAAEHYEPEVK